MAKRPEFKDRVNLSNRDQKNDLLDFIGPLTGWFDIDLSPIRETRSMRQHKYYFAAIVTPFSVYLSQQDNDHDICGGGKDAAHEILKKRYLSYPVCDPRTGEIIDTCTKSTTKLTIGEMHDYIERCRHWLWDWFKIRTRDPDERFVDDAPKELEAVA